MINPMNYPLLVLAITFLILRVSAKAGSRLAASFEPIREDFGIIQGATLTLFGLLLGFTFSMAVTRYDQRKLREAEEANAIGTEYRRAELLSPSDAENVQALLRQYLQQRILFYRTRDGERLQQIDAASTQLQTRLWASVRGPSVAEQTPLKL